MDRSEYESAARRVRCAGQWKIRAECVDERGERGDAIGPAFPAHVEQLMWTGAKEQRTYENRGCLEERTRPPLRIEAARGRDNEPAADRSVDLDVGLGSRCHASKVCRSFRLEAGPAIRDDARSAQRNRIFIVYRSSDPARRAGRRPAD